jgi:serine protease Do
MKAQPLCQLFYKYVKGGFFRSFFFCVAGVFASEGGDFLSLQRRCASLFKERESSVVRVKGLYQGVERTSVQFGTGFFISDEGHVLTTASNIKGADRVLVELHQVNYPAEVLGFDEGTNFALLKVQERPKSFTSITLSASESEDEPCTMSLLMAFPRYCPVSPKLGMLAGSEGYYEDNLFPTNYLRVTWLAADGEHGGPVFDLNGRLLGMLITSLPEIQASYLLPTRALLRLRDDILFSGRVKYGYVGIDVAQPARLQRGDVVIVSDVHPKSPAAEAGLLKGDELLRFGSFKITSIGDVRNAAFFARPGEYTTLTVRRYGGEKTLNIRIAASPEAYAAEVAGSVGG